MMTGTRSFGLACSALIALGGCSAGEGGKARRERVAPVEVAPVRSGPIALRRIFSGSLEPEASITVAPKLTGRVRSLTLDIGDPVERGETVATLETLDLRQAVDTAKAELALQRAGYQAAIAERDRAQRNLERIETLHAKNVTAESQLDEAKAAALSASARVDEAAARVARAKAELSGAEIRLAYTRVEADWPEGDDSRIVAERFVDPGDLVAENSPIYRVVEIDPVTATFFVTERDYSRLAVDQAVTLTTDAHPGESFEGRVARISPVFAADSRQARVEVRVPNEGSRLRPGMFIRAIVELESVDDATLVPKNAIVRREGKRGVFLVTDDGKHVEWREVEVGIVDGATVQLLAPLAGEVVTLGHQLVEDGSKIRVPERERKASVSASAEGATTR